MSKKYIVGAIVIALAVLGICCYSLNKPNEAEINRLADLTEEFNEEYGYDCEEESWYKIEVEMVSKKKLSSEKFDGLEVENQAAFCYMLYHDFSKAEKMVIVSNGNKYKFEYESADEYTYEYDAIISLYKNGELIDEIEHKEPQSYSLGGSDDDDEDYSDLKWEPTIGMTKSEVLDTTWGTPDDRNITETEYGDVEQWIYNDLGWVYFTDGICDGIQYKDDLN